MKLKLSIPETLNEIPLESYQRYLSHEEKTDETILDCFFGIRNKDLFEIKKADADYLVQKINKLFDNPPSDLITTFKMNGIEFGFIPKLDDITYGENIDISGYINKPETYHQAMAVLYRPIVKKQFGKYLIEPYEGSDKFSELFKKAPVSVFWSAQVFFYDLTNDLLSYIHRYLSKEKQRLLVESGEVTQVSLESLISNLTKLREQPKQIFTKL